MKIDIDKNAGFCWGVVKTIELVESELNKNHKEDIYVLGDIIHNPREIERLESKSLKTVKHDKLELLETQKTEVIIRAHGEPPSTYTKLENLGLNVIDATCPLVKNLQQRVRKFYLDGWRVMIFGKKSHAEVIGLRGVCNDDCVVIKNVEEAIENIDYERKTMLFSQTTMDKPGYKNIKDALRNKFKERYPESYSEMFVTKDTICKFVSNREPQLRKFASEHEIVLFVAGRDSSNGKSLFNVCKSVNDRTIFIESYEEIEIERIKKAESIGITGATSTPQWYMEKVKEKLTEAIG